MIIICTTCTFDGLCALTQKRNATNLKKALANSKIESWSDTFYFVSEQDSIKIEKKKKNRKKRTICWQQKKKFIELKKVAKMPFEWISKRKQNFDIIENKTKQNGRKLKLKFHCKQKNYFNLFVQWRLFMFLIFHIFVSPPE